MPKCLLVSNRLPFVYNKSGHQFEPSSGGLVSAIKGLKASQIGYDLEWIGFITDEVPDQMQKELTGATAGDHKCHPVVIEKDIYHQYYSTFCNNVLWPLFHYERSAIQLSGEAWKCYLDANQLMANAILEMAKTDDTIWINDFHLFLLPGMLKSKRPELKVGFFLHIPFPVAEIYRELPQRKEILESLLTCDQLGFQDLSYLTHFKTAVDRILGHKVQSLDENRWGVYPVSIETEKFIDLASDPKTTSIMATYTHHKKEKKWVLGIDRLDSIKGLILKLKAFECFIKTNPELARNTQLVQLVIPSRLESIESQKLKAQIEELVSNINGQFGSLIHTPILYLSKSINDFELSAFYQLSEVMHISSIRDGMNLVGLEYVASQKKTLSKTLLLSEFAGAHSSLSYAKSINPWDIEGTADKIKQALEESGEKKSLEMKKMQEFLKEYNSSVWAKDFLTDLNQKCQIKSEAMSADDVVFFPWMKNLKNQKIMIFCDFDGTLAPLSTLPHQVELAAETKELLERVYHHRNIEIVIVSGRDRDFLQKKFAHNKYLFPLAACHGAYYFTPDTGEWNDLMTADSTPWRMKLNDILNVYTSRTPESYFEDKGHSTTWHYRNCPQDFGEYISNKLFVELKDSLASFPVHITRGKKTIEISSLQANKGHFIHQWLKRQEYHPDVIIALGDDKTDEDMFDQLQNRTDLCPYCIKIGLEKTNAQYFIKDQTQVNAFFNNLLHHI